MMVLFYSIHDILCNSKDYVPFCALAVIEKVCGQDCVDDSLRDDETGAVISERVEDPFLYEVSAWGYQECMTHQKQLVDRVAELHNIPNPNPPATPTMSDSEVVAAVASIDEILGKIDASKHKQILQEFRNKM